MSVNLLGSTITWPGRAGEAQARDDLGGLIAELGDNYERYHAFLAQHNDGLNAKRHDGDEMTPLTTLDLAAERQSIAAAEVGLRLARLTRQQGPQPTDHHPPELTHEVFDAERKLVSILDPPTDFRRDDGRRRPEPPRPGYGQI